MNKLLNFMLTVLGLLLIIVAIFVIGLTVFTNIIPEHSLIYVLDIPEIAVVTSIIFSSFLFLLLPGLILITFTRIINLLEEITNL